MTRRDRLGAFLVCLLSTAVVADPPSPGADVPGRLIVQLEPGASLDQFINVWEADHADLGLQLDLIESDPDDGKFLLGFDPSGLSEQQIAELEDGLCQYMGGLISWGELDHGTKAPEDSSGTTGDVWFYVGNGGPLYSTQYAVQKLGLLSAQTHSTGAGVVIAVLDTGIDASHPALGGRVLPNGYNFVNGNTNTADVGDGIDNDGDGAVDELTGHGTFVASLIHLVAPEAWILPVRVLDSDGRGDSWAIAQGIEFAVSRGVEVINMSLGSPEGSDAVADALDEANGFGIVTVAAAGNFNSDQPELFPATYGATLGVAAVDNYDLKAPFSNYNEDLSLSAPGASTKLYGNYVLNLSIVGALPGGLYAISEGTSFSAAFVSGAAALIRAQHPEWPSGSMTLASIVPAISDIMAAHAVPIDALNPPFAGLLGAGRLDAASAVWAGPAMPVAGDLNADGSVNLFDLMNLLSHWGMVHSSADISADGVVDVADILMLMTNWH